jgi:hypothetical protein
MYDQRGYFPMEPTYWGYSSPVYPQFPLWGFNHWEPYLTRPTGNFQQEYISRRHVFRPRLHEKRARFSQEARLQDAIVIQGSWSEVHCADGKSNKGSRKLMWVPVRSVKSPDGFNVAQDLKLGEHQPAVGVLNNPKTSSIVRLGSVQREAVNRERDDNDVKL